MSTRSSMMVRDSAELERRRTQFDSVVPTWCPMCPACCGMEILVKDGKAKEVAPMLEHPMGIICPRGEATIEWEYSPDRLTYPRRRVGNTYQRLSWDEALDFAAEELTKIKEKYGPEALVTHMGQPFIDTSIDVMTRIFTQAYGTPNFTTGAAYCNAVMVMSNRLTFGQSTMPSAFPYSKCIVVWGSNPAESSQPQLMAIHEGKKAGARVIVVDPRTTKTVKEIADIHVKIRPGTDSALALGLIKVIIDEGLYNKSFVEKWTVGFDGLPEAVKEYTPERVEEITWVPADTVRDFARTFATKKPACIIQGISPQHSVNAMDANRGMTILMAMTGNIDIPGSNCYFTKQGYNFPGVWEDTPPPKRISLKKYPIFVEMYRQPSNNLVFNQMLTGKPYPVKGLIVIGSNVLLTWPNTNKVRRALESLDFLIDIDVMENSTTRMADLVLPAATYLEKDEIKNYAYTGLPMMGMCRKAVEPLGEAWPEFKIWTELGKRMGYESWFHWDTVDELFQEITESIDIDYKELKEVSRGAFYGSKQTLRKYRREGFNTPSGKAEIYSETLKKYGYNPLPSYREPVESPVSQPDLARKYPLTLMTGGRSLYFTHGQFRNIPSLREKVHEPLLEINPNDAEKFGIANGDEVMVETLRGEVKIKANVTKDIMPGVVHMMHGWEESNANILTNDDALDPISSYTEFRVNLCRVKKLSE
ncbi:MAG: molybdopterin-dependent oxidoreductase [Thermodesulfobacteriota bacterium]|nr:molybdopterin-dependent oxidoreductase [Thermodesulfobacteriota bacterium]